MSPQMHSLIGLYPSGRDYYGRRVDDAQYCACLTAMPSAALTLEEGSLPTSPCQAAALRPARLPADAYHSLPASQDLCVVM